MHRTDLIAIGDCLVAIADEARGLIEKEGGRCSVHRCDVTDAASVAAMVQACLDAHGRVDVLINNAGRSEPGGPVDMDEAVWRGQLDLNLTSVFLTCKHVIPEMQAQGGGAIVNISSVAGMRYVGKPQVAYAAAKAGLMHFTHTTAVIHAAQGVRINCVVPGLMHTPLVARLAQKYAGGDLQGFIDTRNRQVPMGRMGDAWDVARAVLFLASDEARYITGTEIVVDGGLTAATR